MLRSPQSIDCTLLNILATCKLENYRIEMNTPSFFVHDRALCDTPDVGSGTRIWGFTHILSGARIGKNCNIGEQVFIENQVQIGDGCTIKNGVALWDGITLEQNVFVGPYAVFTNDLKPRAFIKKNSEKFLATLIRQGATIGANATIICGTEIGVFAFVAAGAVVTRNVPPHSLVVGNPARIIGRVCYCAERLDSQDFCQLCNKMLNENSVQLFTQSGGQRFK